MLDRSRAVRLAGDGAKLTRALRVLIRCRILPARLVKGVRDGARLALAILLLDDEGTAGDACVPVVRVRHLVLLLCIRLRIVQVAATDIIVVGILCRELLRGKALLRAHEG